MKKLLKVQEVSKMIWKSMQEENIEVFKKYVHEDAMFVHMGVTLSREEERKVIQERGIIYKDIDFEAETMKQVGSTIVLLTKLKLTAIVGGNEVINPFVVSEIYTTQEDGMKLVSMSYTRITY